MRCCHRCLLLADLLALRLVRLPVRVLTRGAAVRGAPAARAAPQLAASSVAGLQTAREALLLLDPRDKEVHLAYGVHHFVLFAAQDVAKLQ